MKEEKMMYDSQKDIMIIITEKTLKNLKQDTVTEKCIL